MNTLREKQEDLYDEKKAKTERMGHARQGGKKKKKTGEAQRIVALTIHLIVSLSLRRWAIKRGGGWAWAGRYLKKGGCHNVQAVRGGFWSGT